MTTVVSVRVNEEERALLEAASTLAAISLSDSIRLKAREAAEAGILDRRAARGVHLGRGVGCVA